MELHAMELKSKGAMVARTLSYEGCEFEGISNVMSEEMEKVYNKSSDLWMEMHVALLNKVEERRKRIEFENLHSAFRIKTPCCSIKTNICLSALIVLLVG
jgi:hypothetical protein